MIGLRDLRFRRFGAVLAGLALYLQLAFASWGMLALAARGEPVDGLGGHALCLAGTQGDNKPAAPADSAPVAPVHDHFGFCCLWHPVPGVAPQAAQVPQPVVYIAAGHDEGDDLTVIPGVPSGSANARAPPTLT